MVGYLVGFSVREGGLKVVVGGEGRVVREDCMVEMNRRGVGYGGWGGVFGGIGLFNTGMWWHRRDGRISRMCICGCVDGWASGGELRERREGEWVMVICCM